jgi:putative transposase
VAAALKGIYRAVDAAAGEAALNAFEEGFWGQKYPAIGQSWRRAWGEVVPFYAFPGVFLVLNRSEKQWIMPPREWPMAKSQFAALFRERFTAAMN